MAVVEAEHSLAANDPNQRGQIVTFERRVLARIPEQMYRGPDIEQARRELAG